MNKEGKMENGGKTGFGEMGEECSEHIGLHYGV